MFFGGANDGWKHPYMWETRGDANPCPEPLRNLSAFSQGRISHLKTIQILWTSFRRIGGPCGSRKQKWYHGDSVSKSRENDEISLLALTAMLELEKPYKFK